MLKKVVLYLLMASMMAMSPGVPKLVSSAAQAAEDDNDPCEALQRQLDQLFNDVQRLWDKIEERREKQRELLRDALRALLKGELALKDDLMRQHAKQQDWIDLHYRQLAAFNAAICRVLERMAEEGCEDDGPLPDPVPLPEDDLPPHDGPPQPPEQP